jgi:NitT/TauT family transport system substrate-binding protein
MRARSSLLLIVAAVLVVACAPAPAPRGVPAPAPAAAGAASQVASAPAPAASQAPPAATARPLTRATVAVPAVAMPFLPLYVAKQKGFDRENGVDLDLQIIGGRVGVQSMLGGSLDFTSSAGSILNARLGGAPVVVLMIGIDKSTYMLYARPEIRAVQDLKGKTVAVDTVGGSQYSELGLALQKLGMELSDLTVVGVQAAARLPALESGAVDAMVVSPPEDVRAERLGLGFHRLLRLGDSVVGINGGLGVTTAALQAKPELVDAVVATALMGYRYVRENREGTLPLMMSYFEVDAETAALIYDNNRHAYSDGASTEAIRGEITQHAADVLQPDTMPALAEIYELRPLERAAAKLQASGWQPR